MDQEREDERPGGEVPPPGQGSPAQGSTAVGEEASPAAGPVAPLPRRRLAAAAAVALLALCSALLGAAAGALAVQRRSAAVPTPPAALPSPTRPVATGIALDPVALYRAAAPAVVQVARPGGAAQPGGAGSGFVFDARGYILTNHHVVAGSAQVQVRLDDGTVLRGTVVGSDPDEDLAVVRVDPGGRLLPALRLGDSDAVQPGEPVVAIGYPLGQKAVTAGIVSGKGRTATSPAGWPQLGMIQTDAALYPGSSGGPLLNARGEVIGIAAQVVVEAGSGPIGLAIPVNTARRLLPDLMAGRRAQRAWLGIAGTELTPELAAQLPVPVQRGVVVVEVIPGSPAAAAGLRPATRTRDGGLVPGDVILAVDGQPVGSVAELAAHIQRRRPGEGVSLTVLREGRRVEIPVTLAARPDRAP